MLMAKEPRPATARSRWPVRIRRLASLQMPLHPSCGKSWSQSVTPVPSAPKISGNGIRNIHLTISRHGRP